MVVAYDYVHGEPRGKLKKSLPIEDKGDCVDCLACVKVCPTGIDIRNGTQLECVNCTACIDACNAIMEKINKPLGLIRYASEEAIAEKKKTTFNGRMAAYSGVLVALLGVLVFLLVSRDDVDATVLHTPGQIFQQLPDGRIANLYSIKLANKTRNELPLTLKIENMKGEIEVIGKPILVPGESYFQTPFFVKVDKSQVARRKTSLVIGVYERGEKIKTAKTTLMGPWFLKLHRKLC